MVSAGGSATGLEWLRVIINNRRGLEVPDDFAAAVLLCWPMLSFLVGSIRSFGKLIGHDGDAFNCDPEIPTKQS